MNGYLNYNSGRKLRPNRSHKIPWKSLTSQPMGLFEDNVPSDRTFKRLNFRGRIPGNSELVIFSSICGSELWNPLANKLWYARICIIILVIYIIFLIYLSIVEIHSSLEVNVCPSTPYVLVLVRTREYQSHLLECVQWTVTNVSVCAPVLLKYKPVISA